MPGIIRDGGNGNPVSMGLGFSLKRWFSTSYIPTFGDQATRGVDLVQIRKMSLLNFIMTMNGQ